MSKMIRIICENDRLNFKSIIEIRRKDCVARTLIRNYIKSKRPKSTKVEYIRYKFEIDENVYATADIMFDLIFNDLVRGFGPVSLFQYPIIHKAIRDTIVDFLLDKEVEEKEIKVSDYRRIKVEVRG